MKKIISGITALVLTVFVFAQDKTDSILFENVKFRSIGPFRGGRSAAVCGDYKNKNLYYMGATGGGVWKTTDAGNNWKNISDGYFGGSIGAIATAPSDASVIYVGEGENTVRGNVSEGFGMWRSDDGGRKWKHIGLKDTRHILRIVIHPKNPDIVWVAALGHLFGPNDERGVFKTIDGGLTWKRVLFSDKQSGAVDLVMEPGNPQTLYATTWTVIRTPYSLESGGSGSALWKSTDAGETWVKLNNKKGFPSQTTLGIIGVAVAPSNPDKVYALVENSKGGLYVSNDAGETWNLQNSENDIRQRAWYYTKVFVDTKNEDVVYVLNVSFLKSTNGGKNFKEIDTPHGDHHDLWIDPEDPMRMIVADDGGAQVSNDGGNNWSTYQNQPTAQIYRVSTDNHFPYRILGAQQDNSTIRILSQTDHGEISEQDWTSTAGFESGYVVADPLNPDIVYGGNYSGFLSRMDHKTGENRAVSVWPDNPIGAGADFQKYRFQWNFPIFFSPHNPKKLYAAGNVLFASEDEGATWTALGGDLTTNDKTKQGSSGGPITQDNTTVEYYCTIFTAAECKLEKDVLWTGSDDGLIHVSRDGGTTWTNVTPPAAKGKWMMWNCVETDPFTKGKAYFVGTRYKSDDFTPYIYKTEDYGKTWKLITKGIAANHFARALRADQKKPGLLYCGTEYGMYISYDDGANWKSMQLNLPMVPITDLALKNNDLIVATQGRAFWVLDDLTPVQTYQKTTLDLKWELFDVSATYRMPGYRAKQVRNAGMNPHKGVLLNYYLKEPADSTNFTIIIKDKNHKVITSFTTKEKDEKKKLTVKKGMNQFEWNMMYPSVEKIEGMIMWNGNINGPKAAPGEYFACLKSGNDSIEKPFKILANPVYKCTQQEYEEQFDFLIQVKEKFAEVQQTIRNIRDLRAQIERYTALNGDKTPPEIKQLCDTIQRKLTKIEEKLYQTKLKSGQDILNYPMQLNDRISALFDYASSGNYAPTKQVKEAFEELKQLADKELASFNGLLENEVKLLNEKIRQQTLPIIGIKEKK